MYFIYYNSSMINIFVLHCASLSMCRIILHCLIHYRSPFLDRIGHLKQTKQEQSGKSAIHEDIQCVCSRFWFWRVTLIAGRSIYIYIYICVVYMYVVYISYMCIYHMIAITWVNNKGPPPSGWWPFHSRTRLGCASPRIESSCGTPKKPLW